MVDQPWSHERDPRRCSMSPEIIAIVVGLLAGWVANFLVKDRGFGMTADLSLGLGGGMLAVIFVQALGVGVEAAGLP